MAVELGAVLHRSSVLSESLDGALKSFTFGNGCSIYLIALCKDIGLDLCSQSVLLGILETELAHISLGADAGLLEMSHLRLVCAVEVNHLPVAAGVLVDDPLLLVHKAHLNCLVAVVLHGLDLRDHAGACLKNRHRNQHASIGEDLGHSDFRCQNCFLHFSSLSAHRASST